jgi:hypothetical protein
MGGTAAVVLLPLSLGVCQCCQLGVAFMEMCIGIYERTQSLLLLDVTICLWDVNALACCISCTWILSVEDDQG